MELSCTAQDPFASASDTLQLVVDEHTHATRNASTNVRYASACRQRCQHSTSLKSVNVESAQRMSDTLQLVVNVANTHATRKASTKCPICFSLSSTLPTLNPVRIRPSALVSSLMFSYPHGHNSHAQVFVHGQPHIQRTNQAKASSFSAS